METAVALLKQRVDSLWETIHGGQNVEWEQSIRGKLHAMADFVAASKNLEQATRNIHRSYRQRLSLTTQIILCACAILAAASPYVIALH